MKRFRVKFRNIGNIFKHLMKSTGFNNTLRNDLFQVFSIRN